MFILGLILLLLSAGAVVAVLASGTDDQAALYGGSLDLPTLVVFLAGMAALLVFALGLVVVRTGLRRANQNRKNNKRLRTLEKRERQRGGDPSSPSATQSDPSSVSSSSDASHADEGTVAPGAPYQDPPAPSR